MSTAVTDRKAYTMHEVAESLGVSYQTVRRLVARGLLRCVNAGSVKLVPAEALDEFLAGELAVA